MPQTQKGRPPFNASVRGDGAVRARGCARGTALKARLRSVLEPMKSRALASLALTEASDFTWARHSASQRADANAHSTRMCSCATQRTKGGRGAHVVHVVHEARCRPRGISAVQKQAPVEHGLWLGAQGVALRHRLSGGPRAADPPARAADPPARPVMQGRTMKGAHVREGTVGACGFWEPSTAVGMGSDSGIAPSLATLCICTCAEPPRALHQEVAASKRGRRAGTTFQCIA